ncbi:glycosyltransferase [Vampirovibrio sp.]|uniref:glycosyltransferase n=1 Tax=Vampirovibrio sp. TaxID=2717857 RepID=UPI0035939AB2
MEHWIVTGLGAVILLGYILTTISFMRGNRSIRALSQIPIAGQGEAAAHPNFPTVSVIIPARNEARDIEAALNSVLKLDYPNYELIVLNDRSEDQTGPILDRLAEIHPTLQVVHIHSLPHGWLGKNHALWQGASMANGELLLFTDADVVFEPSALRRAVQFMQHQSLDHLSAMPGLLCRSLELSLFMGAFSLFFCMYSRPWNAKDPKRKDFIGIGAFNLIKKSVYDAVGTHQSIALRPDDDMKLGKRVKLEGFRQDLCDGSEYIQVEWYHSLPEMIDGLMKNAFAGLNYSVPYALGAVFAQLLYSVWPVFALFFTTGITGWIYASILVLMQIFCLDHLIKYRLNRWSGLFFPLSTLLVVYIILRATALTLMNDGIRWRGTHYPLAALKANRV